MSFKVYWDSPEKQYVIAESQSEWTWEAFYSVFKEIHQLVGEVDYRVDIVMWHKTKLPSGNPLIHFKAAMKDQPTNTGQVFVIPHENTTIQRFLQTLAGVTERLYPGKSEVVFVSSMDEAREKLTAKQAQE